MHPAFESLKSYAAFKGWPWSDDLTMLALDAAEDWDEVDEATQLDSFYEVFAQLLFENAIWAGFRLFAVPFKYWPAFINGRPVSHYHIHRNPHSLLLEVTL